MSDGSMLPVGTVLVDRYRLERLAGQGGMATVFEATDLKQSRTVAVKVLAATQVTADSRARFQREIQIVANLTHPNILPLHDSGEADGVLFFVMPFVTGETLATRLARDGRLPLDDVLRTVREVGQALAYAHARGIIHRDLKPANIMFSEGVAVVTDFGIARALNAGDTVTLTQVGSSLGTPTYMSPEQALADSDVSARSDQYALGCITYEMLAGTPPFTGQNMLALLAQHASSPVPPLHDRRPDVPAHWAEAVQRAMAKEPAARFDSVADFVRAIDTGVAHGATPPSGSTHATVTGAVARPQRRGALLAAAAVLVAAVAGAAWIARRAPATVAPVVAVLTFEHLGPPDAKYVTDGITDEVASRIADVPGITLLSRSSSAFYDLRKQKLAEIGSALHATHLLAGTVQTARRADGTLTVHVVPRLVDVATGRDAWTGELDAVSAPDSLLPLQASVARGVANALNVALDADAQLAFSQVATRSAPAYNAYLRGILHQRQELVRGEQLQAIEDLGEAVRIDSTFAVAQARLAQVLFSYILIYDPSAARVAQFNAAVAQANALAPDLPATRIARGHMYRMRQQADSARREYEWVLARQPNNATALYALGTMFLRQARFDLALDYFKRYTVLDPRSYFGMISASTASLMAHRLDDCAAFVEKAWALQPESPATEVLRGQVLYVRGDTARLRAEMQRLVGRIDIVRQLLSDPLYRYRWESFLPAWYDEQLGRMTLAESGADTVEFWRAKARHYERAADSARARALYDSIVPVLRSRIKTASRPAFLRGDLAWALAGAGHTVEARAMADTANATLPITLDTFRGFFATWDIVRVDVRLGNFDRALAVMKVLEAPKWKPFVMQDPLLAPVRATPGFAALMSGS